jgi:hypothetical protein
MRLNWFLVSSVSLLFAFAGGSRLPQSKASTVQEKAAPLSVKIGAPGTTFAVGTSIPIQIEIRNISEKDIWIAVSLDEELGTPSNLPLWVRDSHRRRVLPESYVQQSEFGGRAAHESWVHLSPGYAYRRRVYLTRFISSFLDTPGKYDIEVYYQGIRCGDAADSGCPSSEPTRIFADKIESNSMSVEIVASGHR